MKKILIVDDQESKRKALAEILSEEFQILEAVNGMEASKILERLAGNIALVLLDFAMPVMDGLELLHLMEQTGWIKMIPVIMIASESSMDEVDFAYEQGAVDYINWPLDRRAVRYRVKNAIMAYEKKNELSNMIVDQLYEREKDMRIMIEILSNLMAFRNGESGLHVLHMHTITEMLLRELQKLAPRYGITETDIILISNASALHDIGKIAVPEEILNCPGKLSDEELKILQSHPLEGARILKDIPYWKDEALLQTSYQVCRWHHERYDGSGYPDGLVGDETPIAAQVVALADVYDALISNRAYKEAYTHEKAVEMIRNGECGAFNPVLLKCLENISFELDKTLNKVSLEYRSEEETLRTVEYLLRKGNVDVSNGTLHRLEYERMKYRFFADMSQEIQFEYAVDSKLLIMTEAGAKALGVEEVTANPLKNEHIGSIVGENLLENIQKIITKCTPEQPIVQCEGDLVIHGEWRRCHVVCCSVWSQGKIPVITGYIGKLVDVREQPMLEVSLQQQVTQDSVTGLLNRSFAKTTAERRLQQQQEKDFVLAIFDVEHFRDANMKYGHIFGDALLKQVAKRLKDCTRDYDITARVGGDEFMVVMEDSEDNTQIMKRIVNTLSGKYQEFYISIRMGISRTKEVGREYDVLFHCADRALYTACYKQQEQMCFYDDSMKDKSSVISSIDREEKV